MPPISRDAKVFVTGHRGLVGSALMRRLETEGFSRLLTAPRADLDLRVEASVYEYFRLMRPEVVFLAAAKVGGIAANSSFPADFIFDNLRIQTNVIGAAFEVGVQKLVFLGSSCIYPKLAPQPLREEYLLSGPLEPTNEWYAVAKIAGLKLVQALRRQHGFPGISLMPTNLYGPNDNFDLSGSHVLPAFLRKFHEAKLSGASTVEIWGSGAPRREFLHVDDLASAAVYLLDHYDDERFINVGTGTDLTISELATLVAKVVGWTGQIVYDSTKPDGTPVKRLDVSRLSELGWSASIPLEEGLRSTYSWYVDHAPS
ncbi:MAG: GDP-L-fucose synthase [Deltaproteobacteria bacterium]|nr:GDP-L-fucose synthase [Deltaproteobacteria bacterium]